MTHPGDYFNSRYPNVSAYWAINQPNSTEKAKCLAVGNLAQDRWDDVACDGSDYSAPLSRLCMRTVGYSLASNRRFYKIMHEINKYHTEAMALCLADGGRIAIAPYGPTEIKAIEPYVAQMSGLRDLAKQSMFRLDGTDAAVEGIWNLPDGNSTNQASYAITFCLGAKK